jgi:hypothetical protein
MLVKTDENPTDLGYYLIDQRASGIPVSAGRPLVEMATFTCTHCSAVVVLNPERTRPRTKCYGCNHLICDSCAAQKAIDGRCHTIMQKYEEHMTAVARQAEVEAGRASPILLP